MEAVAKQMLELITKELERMTRMTKEKVAINGNMTVLRLRKDIKNALNWKKDDELDVYVFESKNGTGKIETILIAKKVAK